MTNGNGAPLENTAPPQFNVLAQYIKDFSFENPNSPPRWRPRKSSPQSIFRSMSPRTQLPSTTSKSRSPSEGKAETRQSCAVRFRADLCRRVPHSERPAGQHAPVHHDRVPAAAVPVRPGNHRNVGALRGFPPLMLDPVVSSASIARTWRVRPSSSSNRSSRAKA